MSLLGIRLIGVFCFCCASGLAEVETVLAEDGPTASGRNGERLLAEADQLHVRTTFLKEIPRNLFNLNSTTCRRTPRSTTLASIE